MRRDDDVFARALELPPEEREGFVDRTCHDNPDLRARVIALLDAHLEAASFMEEPPAPFTGFAIEEKPGDVLGRYALVEKIGEGGCGVVYLAEQREPVRRRVALKVIKLGMDTKQVIARFDAERQVLALMDHPAIARVFDAGATERGRPFFVMELVQGVPITRFCSDGCMSVRARLELFAQVCVAVQHAHQKGIIHRDLKPSNILITRQDGVPTPKIIDFGIAKATQGRVTDLTVQTRVDQFVGTPSYMSPEQTERTSDDIDTRSDIYSLGVLLYELLVGRLPFDPKTLDFSAVDAIRRIICETEPPRPSARFASLTADDRKGAALLRATTPERLAETLRGDLDWIVMRCLEKERGRRYSTALDLAEDVRRYLREEPVEARPPETIYRLRKFVARNRLACGSAAAIAVALIAGTVVSLRQAVRARAAEQVARAERDAATAAQAAEALARGDAQRRQEQAEDLVAFMLGDFRAGLAKVGQLKLLDAVGEKALEYFDSLDARDLTDTALARQAKALTQIGEVRTEQARYDDAEKAFATAYERAATLAARHPQNGEMLFERAQAEYWRAFVHMRRAEIPPARKWLTDYRDSALALVALDASRVDYRHEAITGYHNLAVLELEANRLEPAQVGFEAELTAVLDLLKLAPDNISLQYQAADATSWLGSVAEQNGNFAEASARFTEQIMWLKRVLEAEPTAARWQLAYANALSLHAHVLSISGRLELALSRTMEAQEILERLQRTDPQNQVWRRTACGNRLREARLLRAGGDVHRARTIVTEARQQYEAQAAIAPADKLLAERLGGAWRYEAEMRHALTEPEAADCARQAMDILVPLAERPEANAIVRSEAAMARIVAGEIAAAAGDTGAANREWEKAAALVARDLSTTTFWRVLDAARRALTRLGRDTEVRDISARLKQMGYVPLDGGTKDFR